METERQAVMQTRVVLVDDHDLIRAGLRMAFEGAGDFDVVGEAGSVAEAVSVVDRLRPQVLVVDIRLPDGDGIELAQKVRRGNPTMGIVVLTMYAGDDHLFAAIDAGASGFVTKDAPADDVVAAARHAAVNPGSFTARDLAGAVQRRSSEPAQPKLSPREGEVLTLLVSGLTVTQISRRLFIAETTTKTHIRRVYEKLGAGNRAQAVMKAIRLGLVKDITPDDDFGPA